MKHNCWEALQCGREPNGIKTKELGVCPATTFAQANGYLGGTNGGRGCTYITGTFCGGIMQGTYKEKEKQCGDCNFYKTLRKEYGAEMSVLSFNNYVKGKQVINS